MTESSAHKQAKARAAGPSGRTEVPLSRNRRLDAVTKKTATEIERSGTMAGLKKAASRLKESGKPQRVLQVPQRDMSKAVQAMQTKGVHGTVKNMSGTKRRSISKNK
ncbi:MAG: hypothetical protein ACE5GQ_11045 [Nitrospinales bacterium]